MTRRGDEIGRPNPWTVRAADRRAGIGWDILLRQVPEATDRAWVCITADPRRTDSRQHRLKGSLGLVTVGNRSMEQWQFEVTAGGRVWYGIDDAARTLWITHAGTAHPRQTDRGKHG
ncbi:MAG: hypothetical protein ACRDUV_13815 [Pseudonocardiaceae bacterium]